MYKRINRKREALCAAGALDQPELGDKNPHFRLVTFPLPKFSAYSQILHVISVRG